MRVLRDIALSIVSAMPGIMIVLIIFVITTFILKLLKVLLNQVEAGRLQLPGIHPETVGATRKLISVVVWLFALSAAYPFLPGANSLAFKGISVFFGLMLTPGFGRRDEPCDERTGTDLLTSVEERRRYTGGG